MNRFSLIVSAMFLALLMVACGTTSHTIRDADGSKLVTHKVGFGLMSVNAETASENATRQAEMGKMTGDKQVGLAEERILVRERSAAWGTPAYGAGSGPQGCKPTYYGQALDPDKAERCSEAQLVRDRRSTWQRPLYYPGMYPMRPGMAVSPQFMGRPSVMLQPSYR